MASTPNDPFAKPLLVVGLALLASALFVLVSNLFTTIERNSTVGTVDTAMIEQMTQQNLAPIGSVVAVDKSVAPVARTGAEIYTAVCTACHASGVLDAPKLEAAAWTERAAKGLKGLVTSAINGINQMPARGGDPSITDDEMHDAVLYMVQQAGLELADESAGSEATAATAATDQASSAPAEAEMATAPATPAQDTATAPQAEAQQAQAAVADNVLDGQKIYQGVCFSCHATGIAGSPMPGDKAVWAPRIAAGMQVLYDNVIKGKGVMPANGGNPALSEDEIKAAVDWMVAESQ